MKKLLLVLLVLGAAVPVNADVFIYNSKTSNAEFEYDKNEEGWSWMRYKSIDKAYVVFEPNSVDANFVNILFVDFWKEKDGSGVMRKYYGVGDVITLELVQAQIGIKLMWIMPIVDSYGTNGLLSGQAKAIKIVAINHTIAATFTGSIVWHDSDGDYRDEGTGTLSWTLNPKMTNNWHTLSGESAKDEIVADLVELGYEPEP